MHGHPYFLSAEVEYRTTEQLRRLTDRPSAARLRVRRVPWRRAA